MGRDGDGEEAVSFLITLDDVAALMGGHYPPRDDRQRDAYFRVLLDRMHSTLTEEQFGAALLPAGGMPEEFEDWERSRKHDRP